MESLCRHHARIVHAFIANALPATFIIWITLSISESVVRVDSAFTGAYVAY